MQLHQYAKYATKYAEKYAKYASNMQVSMILPYIACNMQYRAIQYARYANAKYANVIFKFAEYALPTLLMRERERKREREREREISTQGSTESNED
jgi:hypothetical protein